MPESGSYKFMRCKEGPREGAVVPWLNLQRDGSFINDFREGETVLFDTEEAASEGGFIANPIWRKER
jgi:hypothetical protein